MTLIAGIFSRSHEHPVPESACEALRRSISRYPKDETSDFKDSRSYFVKVDIGAYLEGGAHLAADGSLSLLAGEPLLSSGDAESSPEGRAHDLALIHDACASGETRVLAQAQGVFCAAHYKAAPARLLLISDKLGLRPLYYWVDEKYVAFASALRILESLAEISKKMNVQAVTEIVGLTIPLGNHTPYANIFLLKAGEMVEVTESGINSRQYWRWDEIQPARDSEEELLREAHRRFTNAVARRIRDDKTTVAFLSGGLDSRCVVATLRALQVRVHTFNFARPHTQDQIFGNNFAEQIGSIHTALPKEPGELVPDYSSILGRAWSASPHRANQPAERPSLVWSGEGGSVSLGHVHMSREIVDLMRAGKSDAAIDEFFRREHVYVPPKLLKPEIFNALAGLLKEGIKRELNDLRHPDPARNFYLFLLLNDQRRKLSAHFENIDLHRMEYQLPFFDSAFLSLIVSAPVDVCLHHKFYTRWLAHFHPAVTSVPWQVYPGHEPCPLPIPQGLAYQWEQNYQATERTTMRKQLINQASELLRASDFPGEILNRRNLRLATLIHSAGWRDYEHVLKAAQTYHAYWRKCSGQFALPSNGTSASAR